MSGGIGGEAVLGGAVLGGGGRLYTIRVESSILGFLNCLYIALSHYSTD